MLAYSVVYAFVVSAEDYYVLFHGQLVCHGLVELFAVGGGENDFVIISFGLECGDACIDGLALHDHAGKASERVVVYALVLVFCVVAEVVQMYFHKSLLLCSAKYRL